MSDTTEESSNSNLSEENVKLNEIYFEKLLDECKKRDPNDETLIDDLNNAFRQILDIYLYGSQYEKLYGLISRIANDNTIRHKDELCRICGNLFYENEFPINSLMYYRQSINLNPFNLLSIESFENLLNSFIDRWHYRMINDQTRNFAYNKAINKKLCSIVTNSPPRVLEIGFGCGVLTAQCLLSNQINHPIVYACETNEVFYQIAEKFLKVDHFDPILINKHSNNLSIQNDLNGKQVDVIVTEIFDDGLLGEKCLETFYEALYKNKIIKESPIDQRFSIIPKYARVHICAIECEAIRNTSYFHFKHGDLSIHVISKSEPYTTENLNKLDFKLLSEPIEIDKFKIEFDNFELLRNLCEFESVLKTHSKLKFQQSGVVDAYAVWFDLFLDDEILITNSPLNHDKETRATCWHQAIYPTYDHVGYVNANSSLVIEISLKKDCILIDKLNCEHDMSKELCDHQICGSAAELASLHDFNYQNFFTSCLNEILEDININTGCSVKRLGFYAKSINLVLLEFLADKYADSNIELIWFRDDQHDSFQEFMQSQKLTNKIKCIEIETILTSRMDDKIDYLIYEPLDLNLGVLRKNLFSNLLLIRDSLLINKDKIFPSILSLSGIYIESEELLKETTLTSNDSLQLNSNLNLNLKKILEEYRVSHQFAVNKAQLQNFEALTEVAKLYEIDLRKSDFMDEFKQKTIELSVNKSGKITMFLYWLDFQAIMNENKRIEFKSFSSFIDFNFNLAGIVEYNDHEIKKETQNKMSTRVLLKHDIFFAKVESF